ASGKQHSVRGSPPELPRTRSSERMSSEATSETLPAAGLMRRPSATTVLGMVLVGIVAAWLIVNFVKSPDSVVTNLIIGITNGAIYGLIAIGYSLVYGILELINFAHGDVFMLGGMLTATLVGTLGLASGDAWYVLLGGILLMILCALA